MSYRVDYNVWRRPDTDDNRQDYFEYVLVYMDNLTHLSANPNQLMRYYRKNNATRDAETT